MKSRYTFSKQYPYANKQIIAWTIADGKTAFGQVVEDCGKKFAFGTAKYDYVRVRRFHPSTGKWTKTIVRVRRDAIHGVVTGGLTPKMKRTLGVGYVTP